MPWSTGDVDKHKKGLSSKQKRKWVSIANSALERGADEGTAIRMANGSTNSRRGSKK